MPSLVESCGSSPRVCVCHGKQATVFANFPTALKRKGGRDGGKEEARLPHGNLLLTSRDDHTSYFNKCQMCFKDVADLLKNSDLTKHSLCASPGNLHFLVLSP